VERASVFCARGEELLGIFHPGDQHANRGVLILVGGPQYRVGSHRQFLLLARHLAAHGVPVMRFDYRGMGDSSGPAIDFEHVATDIVAAIDAFQFEFPELRDVIIWGLCDAASAALLYAYCDARVGGLVLLNPWARTEQGIAKAYLKHYYLRRLISRDFWSGLARGRVNPVASIRSLANMVSKRVGIGNIPSSGQFGADPANTRPLPERMADGWRRFRGRILVILSGDDLTAAEFRDVAASWASWRGLLDEPRVCVRELPKANHTFSRRIWRDKVAQWTLEWIG